ncbi:hypothetical protein [Streptomyces sp. Ag109_O5-10]|uniref:hypothetical protein n=1 Tax=Streptomyces sp. Ag109_O5-10 TaxID=1855349 RepID=UPI001C4305C6|nr:hypothetical protein [Streptomyces sp. Ag109_O5-10]
MSGRTQKWIGIGSGSAIVVGLVSYFAIVGLDKADKLSSVLGLLLSIASFVMGWLGYARENEAGQSVQNASVGGGVTQVSGTQGNVRIQRRGVPTSPSSGPPSPGAGGISESGQVVGGSSVGGHVEQVSDTGGDVHIEEEP